MCWCTPTIRTPWCGRPGCEPPDAEVSDMSPLTVRIAYLKEAYPRVAVRPKIGNLWAKPSSEVDVAMVRTLSIKQVLEELEAIIAKHESRMATMREAFRILTDFKHRERL